MLRAPTHESRDIDRGARDDDAVLSLDDGRGLHCVWAVRHALARRRRSRTPAGLVRPPPLRLR